MTNEKITGSRFLKACRREPVDRVPVWLMRQAGRYMSVYRKLREEYGILDIIKTPELAREVTLQPLDAFALDAGIIFADILPPLEGMGLSLEFIKGEGPVIHNPVRTVSDIDRLATPPPEEALWYTVEAVRITSQTLEERGLPLIGFSGAPFTLAAYAVEGGSSRNHDRVKSLMFNEPQTWHRLMSKLATVAGRYMLAQAKAGAHALQLFDSWAGQLSPADYRAYVAPYSKQAIDIARDSGLPIIHFGTATGGILTDMRDAGGDVIGVDWRMSIDAAAELLGDDVAVQGNLDPVVLYADWHAIEPRVTDILDRMQHRRGYIFNLGHGILPRTPENNVRRLVDFVHSYTAE